MNFVKFVPVKGTLFLTALFNFHIRTMHLDIIKVLFIHQLMH